MKIHTYHNPLVLGWGCSVCKSEWVAVGAWGVSSPVHLRASPLISWFDMDLRVGDHLKMLTFAGAVTKTRAVTEEISKRAPSERAGSCFRHEITSLISCQYENISVKYYQFAAACFEIAIKLMKNCDIRNVALI